MQIPIDIDIKDLKSALSIDDEAGESDPQLLSVHLTVRHCDPAVDFGWSPAHPVADMYRAFKPMPYDAPAPALAALLYAVHPDDGYFTLSDPGTIAVDGELTRLGETVEYRLARDAIRVVQP